MKNSALKRFAPVAVLMLFNASAILGQDQSSATPIMAQGLLPYAPYTGGNIDSINLENGNLVEKIPLFSLPQKGQLALSYSLVLNNQGYITGSFCAPVGEDPDCVQYYYRVTPIGPVLTLDQDFTINSFATLQIDNELSGYPYTLIYTLQDASGAQHTLGSDSANPNLFHANDGSGYTYTPLEEQAYNYYRGDLPTEYPDPSCTITEGEDQLYGTGTIASPDGILLIIAPACLQQISIINPNFPYETAQSVDKRTIGDPDGNSINYTIWTDSNTLYNSPGQVTDSVGRTIPSFAALPYSSDVTGCPQLGIANQPAILSRTWSGIPGPNGNSATYLFCYTGVTYNTNFSGGSTRS